MKKYTIFFLLIAILCASLLGACGEKKAPELAVLAPSSETKDIAETAVPNAAETADMPLLEMAPVRHITDTINECHTIDADVYGPASEQVTSYRVRYLNPTPEQAAEVFCPGDPIATKNTREGGYYTIAVTEGGQMVRVGDCVEFCAAEPDPGWYPMMYYSEFYNYDHPETEGADLSFMTAGEAKALAAETLEKLGVTLEPDFTSCATATPGAVSAYLDDLRGQHEFYADWLRGGPDFSGLPEDEECYILRISFRQNGLHLLNTIGNHSEPSVGMCSWEFPSDTACEMIITKDGIQYFMSFGLLTDPEAVETKPLISAEEAIEKFKTMEYANFSLEFESIITKVFMEYVPIPDGEQVVLKPYWCLARVDPTLADIQDAGPWNWSLGSGYRFNAYTGGNLAMWE